MESEDALCVCGHLRDNYQFYSDYRTAADPRHPCQKCTRPSFKKPRA